MATKNNLLFIESQLIKAVPKRRCLDLDCDMYNDETVFEISNCRDSINTPIISAKDFFKIYPHIESKNEWYDLHEEIKTAYPSEYKTLLRIGEEIYYKLFPKGVRDMYILAFSSGKVVVSTKYKFTRYYPYEYATITDLKTLGVSSLSELFIKDKNAYFDLYRKGRELLLSGANKKSTERKGYDWLCGENATPQMFVDNFGFRSISFGSIPKQDIQELLNNAYNAFMDLGMILKSVIVGYDTNKYISNKGKLSLNFGVRNSGNTMAYYSPSSEGLYFTKFSGAGTLAHEWFHALDHYLGCLYNVPLKNVTYTYLCNVMYDNSELYSVLKEWSYIYPTLKMFMTSQAKDGRKKNKYWSNVIELTARCFEFYCLKKLAAQGCKNDFLVENCLNEGVYPQPEDEEKVIQFFDKFFKSLNVCGTDTPYLYGTNSEIPEIENIVTSEISAQIPSTEADRRKFLENELKRFEGVEVYSNYFGQNVVILNRSLVEICHWAAKSKESVIAALNLDGVITNAVKVNVDTPKLNKQTKKFYFVNMYEMHCNIKGLGTAKLMIGERRNGKKITYCITAIQI